MTITELDKQLIEPPVRLCKKCDKLSMYFEHLPTPQPCVWCEEELDEHS